MRVRVSVGNWYFGDGDFDVDRVGGPLAYVRLWLGVVRRLRWQSQRPATRCVVWLRMDGDV